MPNIARAAAHTFVRVFKPDTDAAFFLAMTGMTVASIVIGWEGISMNNTFLILVLGTAIGLVAFLIAQPIRAGLRRFGVHEHRTVLVVSAIAFLAATMLILTGSPS